MKKYEVVIYEDINGNSQIADWIRELDKNPSKENQMMLKKLYYQIERLEYLGTFIGEPIVKQIEGMLWELRPLPNRVFFAVLEGNSSYCFISSGRKAKKLQETKSTKPNEKWQIGSNERKDDEQ